MITCATVVSHNDEPTENHLTLQLKICFRLFAFASLKICIVLLCLFVLCSAFACPCSSFYYWLSVFFVVVNSAVNIVTRVFNTLISIQSHSPKPVKKAGLRRSTRQVAAYTLTSDSLMAVRLWPLAVVTQRRPTSEIKRHDEGWREVGRAGWVLCWCVDTEGLSVWQLLL